MRPSQNNGFARYHLISVAQTLHVLADHVIVHLAARWHGELFSACKHAVLFLQCQNVLPAFLHVPEVMS